MVTGYDHQPGRDRRINEESRSKKGALSDAPRRYLLRYLYCDLVIIEFYAVLSRTVVTARRAETTGQ